MNLAPGIQIAQCREYLQTLVSNVGMLGSLEFKVPTNCNREREKLDFQEGS